MSITYRLLSPGDSAILQRVAPEVFDHDVNPDLSAEFLVDARHHIAVAIDRDVVVGMASAVHYIHPDKPPELWINEVAVTPAQQRQGIGRQLLALLFARGRELGCGAAWVGTELDNRAARALYAAAGGVEAPQPMVMVEFQLMP